VHTAHIGIADLPVDERPRERMARGGAVALSDAELVALLIEPGRKGKSSLEIAREVVADGLLAVSRREWTPGRAVGSLGASRVARIGAALELGRRIASLSLTSSEPIRQPEDAARRLIATYGHRIQETFGAIYLDVRHRIVSEREIFIGTLATASVSPRDVFRFALNDHAAAAIVFHNHPSGDPSPSPQDLEFTSKLVTIGHALGVEVLDHLIVTPSTFVSLKRLKVM
jgi:DNA repair protein RadC